eukprot:scaffold673342_cov62-Prasinocladus_malaysianus.AAC.1
MQRHCRPQLDGREPAIDAPESAHPTEGGASELSRMESQPAHTAESVDRLEGAEANAKVSEKDRRSLDLTESGRRDLQGLEAIAEVAESAHVTGME